MTVSTISAAESTKGGDSLLASRLPSLLEDLRKDVLALALPGVFGEGSGAGFERGVSATLNKMGRAVMGAAIEAVDAEEDQLLLNDVAYYRVGPSRGRMMTSFGAVEFHRSRYRRRKSSSVFPAEGRFGLLSGFWTPLAAEQGTLALSLLPMEDGRAVLHRLGGMEVSGTALNQLLKTSDAAWDVLRDRTLKQAREAEGVPKDAALLVVSLDGTMIGMRKENALPGSLDGCRPAGYREASSGTISFYTEHGKCLHTVRYGRMPEARKLSLKEDLLTEVAHYLELQPDLELVFIADGAPDNWTWCEEAFPGALQLVDYWHALVHLKDALDAAYGEASKQAKKHFQRLRKILKQENGFQRVLRALRHLASHFPGRKTIRDVLRYFQTHADRMAYADAKRRGAPIGSGNVESSNKSIFKMRMKGPGMRWSEHGTGQPIITFRSLWKSGRFSLAWKAIANALAQTDFKFRNHANTIS